MSSYNLKEFFKDPNDKAKQKANIQFDFIYEPNHKNSKMIWMKLMNVILENRQHQQIMEMIN